MPKTEGRGRRKLAVNKNFPPLVNKLIVRTIYDGPTYRQDDIEDYDIGDYAIHQRNKIMARAVHDGMQQTKPEVSSKDEKVNNKEVEFTTKTTVKPPNNPNRQM